jgi:hypothetical protein
LPGLIAYEISLSLELSEIAVAGIIISNDKNCDFA